MKIKIDEYGFMPNRAHDTDAGLDLRSPIDCVVPAHESAVIDTGVHMELPKDTAGLVVSKSGLNTNHDITSTGLVDEAYTGSIRIKLYNHGNEDYLVKRGDKISQVMIVPVLKPDFELVDQLEETERGDNGFGSTGR